LAPVSIIHSLRKFLLRLETWLAGGSLLLLLLLAVLQILARNLFDAGLADAAALTRYLVLYVTFFGAALAVERNRHIRIDIACNFMSPAARARLFRPIHALAALVCAFLTDAAVRYWIDEWQYAPAHEHWLVLTGLVIPVGFCLLTLQFLLVALFGRDEDLC